MEYSQDPALNSPALHDVLPGQNLSPFATPMAATSDPSLAAASDSPAKRKAHGSDRRPLRFWQPFNDWWRSEFERNGKRPSADDIMRWYRDSSELAWGDEKPTLQETRVHAKCLRSVSSVRDYFREYRAKKKEGPSDDGMDQEGSSPAGSMSRSAMYCQDSRAPVSADCPQLYASPVSQGAGLVSQGTFNATSLTGRKASSTNSGKQKDPCSGSSTGHSGFTTAIQAFLGTQPGLAAAKADKPARSTPSKPKTSKAGALSAKPQQHHHQQQQALHFAGLPSYAQLSEAAAAAAAAQGATELQSYLLGCDVVGDGTGDASSYFWVTPGSEQEAASAAGEAGDVLQDLTGRHGSSSSSSRATAFAASGKLALLQLPDEFMDVTTGSASQAKPPPAAPAPAAAGQGAHGNPQQAIHAASDKGQAAWKAAVKQSKSPAGADAAALTLQQPSSNTLRLMMAWASSNSSSSGRRYSAAQLQQWVLAAAKMQQQYPQWAALQQAWQQQQQQLWQQAQRQQQQQQQPGAGRGQERQQQTQQVGSSSAAAAAGSGSAAAAGAATAGGGGGVPPTGRRRSSGFGLTSPNLHSVGLAALASFRPASTGCLSAAAGAALEHSSAGILAELEAVKGPAMAELLQAHVSSQRQRISTSALVEQPMYERELLQRMSQFGELPGAQRTSSLRALPSLDYDTLAGDNFDLASLLSGEDGLGLNWQDGLGLLEGRVLEAAGIGEGVGGAVRAASGLLSPVLQLSGALSRPVQLGGTSPGPTAAAGSAAAAGLGGAAAPGGGLGARIFSSSAGTGADRCGGGSSGPFIISERKRYRSSHRISGCLGAESSCEAPGLGKRTRSSGFCGLLMELDTPRVRALRPAPSATGELEALLGQLEPLDRWTSGSMSAALQGDLCKLAVQGHALMPLGGCGGLGAEGLSRRVSLQQGLLERLPWMAQSSAAATAATATAAAGAVSMCMEDAAANSSSEMVMDDLDLVTGDTKDPVAVISRHGTTINSSRAGSHHHQQQQQQHHHQWPAGPVVAARHLPLTYISSSRGMPPHPSSTAAATARDAGTAVSHQMQQLMVVGGAARGRGGTAAAATRGTVGRERGSQGSRRRQVPAGARQQQMVHVTNCYVGAGTTPTTAAASTAGVPRAAGPKQLPLTGGLATGEGPRAGTYAAAEHNSLVSSGDQSPKKGRGRKKLGLKQGPAGVDPQADFFQKQQQQLLLLSNLAAGAASAAAVPLAPGITHHTYTAAGLAATGAPLPSFGSPQPGSSPSPQKGLRVARKAGLFPAAAAAAAVAAATGQGMSAAGGAAGSRQGTPSRGILPAMHEIERMI